jgi:excinuclease ABC subunit A
MEMLTCKGIRTHNLKNLDLDIPLKKWIAITGVSGSGKSSLAFDTIYAEAQRRFLETLGTYERQFLQGLPQGDFDEIDHIPAAVALKQSNKTGDPRSVIATAADLAEPMRNLFVSLMDWACIKCGSSVDANKSIDLILFLCDEQKKLNRENYLISVPFEIKEKEENLKRVFADLSIEGYTRILLGETIVSIEDLDFSKLASFSNLEIVCDRINCSTDEDEIKNRIETIWSQIRFSTRFSFLNVRKILDGKNVTLNEKQLFHVQPFCKKCNAQTTIIQASDLDWQSILGACKSCNGLGNIPVLDEKKIIPNPDLSLSDGAIKPWQSETFSWMQEELLNECKKKKIRVTEPYSKLSNEEKQIIWEGSSSRKFVSVNEFFRTLEIERYKSTSRILLAKYRKYVVCPDCHGARLGESGCHATCHEKTYYELFQSEITETFEWIKSLKQEKKFEKRLEALSYVYDEVFKKLSLLIKLGLGSCQLFRRCKTLSGGEYQRVLLTRVIGNGLTDALYVLDEPSVGLGKNEISDLILCIQELRDLGNTVLMVEHDKSLIKAADEVIELGPGGGELGGELLPVLNKIPKSFDNGFKNQTIKARISITNQRHFNSNESLYLEDFSSLNCKNLNLEIALGKLNVIGGPSGSGKSTLVSSGLEAALDRFMDTGHTSNADPDLDAHIGIWKSLILPKNFKSQIDVISVEQKAMHRTITSVPATVLGLMDLLRKKFAASHAAKQLDLTASDFSFNGAGGCDTCGGKGRIEDDLFFLGHVEKICPSCNGTRYRPESLEVKWHGKTISGWLSTSLGECAQLLKKESGFTRPLSLALNLGLKHLQLGLATSSMSGGEAQRLRICAALSKSTKKIFCILDEPTRGLSETDIGHLLETLLRLCRQGHTFVVVEHHELFERHADHFIKLGPASGIYGGKIVERTSISE